MAVHVKYTPQAVADLEQLADWVRAAAEGVIAGIAADPDRMTQSFTQGMRHWTGLRIGEGRVCYLSIYFSFISGSDVVTILDVAGGQNQGPH